MPPLRAPEPTRAFFDPFNSSSTGHQRAENRPSGSTSWRDSRTHKLTHQLCDSSGRGGEAHLTDLVGMGSAAFGKDGRKEDDSWKVGAPGLRGEGWQDIRGLMRVSKKRGSDEIAEKTSGNAKRRKPEFADGAEDSTSTTKTSYFSSQASSTLPPPTPTLGPRVNTLPEPTRESTPRAPSIFRSLTLYLNGSTHSSGMSDHKLKSAFIQHGGSLSIALGRRTVTHVVLGSGGGGVLAAGKIQKEVAKLGGKGVKYVTPKWVVDSVECGKRLPESKYQAVHIAMKGQRSVLAQLGRTKQKQPPSEDEVERETDGRNEITNTAEESPGSGCLKTTGSNDPT